MNRPLIFASSFAAGLLGFLMWLWLAQAPSNQELLANVAKALDYAEGWQSVGGPPWWTPSFLSGTSLAPTLTYLGSSLWILAWTAIAGIYSGAKIGGIMCLLIGSLGVYAWTRRLTNEAWAPCAATIAFLCTPSLYVRLGDVEHLVFVTAFAVIPWTLYFLTVFLDTPTRKNGLLSGASFALLLIAYTKAALIMAPLLFLYAGAIWLWKQRTWRLPYSSLLLAAAAIILLGILPNLPALREMRFATVFELAPFEGWQGAFSLKSNILWFDRDGLLSTGMDGIFAPTTAQGGNYLGLIPAALLLSLLFFRPRSFYSSPAGFLCRLAIALALAAHWLSFGPRSILTGQIEFLKLALNGNNLAIPLSWFLLLIQPWIIFRLLPPLMAGRTWIASALSAGYLLVPGFRLISWLPVYSDFRAPHDFSQTGGIFFLALATGLAAILIARAWPQRIPRLAWPALVALSLLDISPYFRPFFQSPLDRATFDDFQHAQAFLAHAPRAGRVHPLSGRYFYLLTPHLAQRDLTTEAFNSYLMQRDMCYLQTSAQLSPVLLQPYLNLAGASYVLIDKKDPDTPTPLQDQFKSLLHAAFENDHFLILENASSLAPAQLAHNFVLGDANPGHTTYAALSVEKLGLITLPARSAASAHAGQVGTLTEKGYRLDENASQSAISPFEPMALSSPRRANYHEIHLAPAPRPGWVLIPEAFHPDWTASAAGKPLPVYPGDGALLAVYAAQPGEAITLRFSPPWWYNTSLALASLGWLSCVILLSPTPIIPRKWKHWLSQGAPPPPVAISQPLELDRSAIHRALVIIPTYDEAHNLPALVEKVLAADKRIELLIVDDNSPDGTARVVREHPRFGQRLHLLARPGKMGLGSAYKDGFQWAFQHGFDACLEMDADFSHDPADLPRLLKGLDDGADAAIGSRYLGGVRVMNWPEHRLLLSTGASRFVRLVTGLPLTDATSGFKALRTSALKTLHWPHFRAEGYGFQIELHYFLWQAGAKLVEVPIIFTERRSGETKMTLGIAIEAAWRTLQLTLTRARSTAGSSVHTPR